MRLMRLLTRPNAGGPTRQAIALWHAHAAQGVRTLLVVGSCKDEQELRLQQHDIPQLDLREALAQGKRAEGFVVLPHLRQGAGWAADLRAFSALRGLVANVRPDVVHTHLAKAGLLGREVARLEGVPVVAHTFHGHVLSDYFAFPKQALLRAIERRLARFTHLIFTVSASCRSEILALGIGTPQTVREIRPAVDLTAARAVSRSAARASLGIGAEVPLLGWCGRLVPIKRFELFAAVLSHIPKALALVVGDGEERAKVAALGTLARWVKFTPEPWETLAAADVLVLTSAREGMPLAALEALASGVAVTGFAVPGVSDVLSHSLPMTVLPERTDVAGLVALTQRMLADPAARARACAAAESLLAECAPRIVAAELVKAYEGALRASPRHACTTPW